MNYHTVSDPNAFFRGRTNHSVFPFLVFILILVLTSFLTACTMSDTADSAIPISAEGGTLVLEDGFQLTIPPEAVSEPLKLRLEAIDAEEFVAASQAEGAEAARQRAIQALPAELDWYGPLYQLELEGPAPGSASLSLPLSPEDLEAGAPLLDLYAWNGVEWQWLPGQVDQTAGTMVAQVAELPSLVTMLAVTPPIPAVAVAVRPDESLPAEAEDTLTHSFPAGFHLEADGRLQTDPGLAAWQPASHRYAVIPSALNWDESGSLNVETLRAILADETARRRHIATLVQLTADYPGLLLDYRGLSDEVRDTFTAFVADLAEALDAEGRQLFVRVGPPRQVAAHRWETGAYDWLALGRLADGVQIPAPLDPEAYATDGSAQALLAWTTGQVDRRKLQWVVSANNLVESPAGWAEISNEGALEALGSLESSAEGPQVAAGDVITLQLSGLSSAGLTLDEASELLWFETRDAQGQSQRLWLMTGASLARRAALVDAYGLAGLVVEGLPGPATDHFHLWPTLVGYRTGLLQAETPVANFRWTVTDSAGAVATGDPAAASYEWPVPETPDAYAVAVVLEAGDTAGVTPVPVASLVFEVPTSTPMPTPTPTLRPTNTPGPTRTPKPTATATNTPGPPPPPPSNNCPVPDHANITYPINGSTIRGIVPFVGTAYLDTLVYYKFEYKPADSPTWQFLTQFDYTWVTNDKLMDFHTYTIAPGVYDFRLIVVDKSGNYPEPCQIRVTVRR